MNSLNRFKLGFTLIELLIVVAIIAILAAIAVPNFLDAQVRSKVARTMADQRSMGTAIGAYVVDYNKPPMDGWVRYAFTNVYPSIQCSPLGELTTPVAYITKMPTNVFWNPKAAGMVGDGGTSVNGFCYLSSYFYVDQVSNAANPNAIQSSGYCTTAKKRGFLWAYDSPGPNTKYGANSVLAWEPYLYGGTLTKGYPNDQNVINTRGDGKYACLLPYDPTNGTRSDGIIAYTNKGIFMIGQLSQ